MHEEPRGALRVIAILLAAIAVPVLCTPIAAQMAVEAEIRYETADGVYIDAGTEDGLRTGDTGRLVQREREIARVQVLNAATDSSFLGFLSARPQTVPAAGEKVTLVLDREADEDAGGERRTSRTLKGAGSDGFDPSLPLLAVPNMQDEAFTEAVNIFHGRVTLREIFQLSDNDDLGYSITHLRTSGTLDRIAATPWSLEWDGDVSYRDGELVEDLRDFQELRLEVYRVALSRRFEDDSVLRVGRFVPRALPAVGFIDGVQGELVVDDAVRLGGIFGFKPTRDDLNITLQEPTAVSYMTIEAGTHGEVYYSGTGGALFSLFDGDPDRLAFLADQVLEIGRLSLISSTEADLDVGGAETYDTARLTRWDIVGTYPFSPLLAVRAGLDRFELPDTEGERDAINAGTLDAEEFFENGYWRYWAGASHDLPGDLRLSEEISYTDADDTADRFRWNVSLSRRGLPGLPAATVTATVYNISDNRIAGYGGRLSAHLPVLEHRLIIQPAVAFRFLDFETRGATFFDRVSEDFTVTDVSVRATWRISRSWAADAGVSYALTDDDNRFLIDIGATFRW